jgi:hypothetical protein
MRPKDEQLLADLMTIIPVMVNSKFRKGNAEHSGDIQDMSVGELLGNANDELLDGFIYCLLAAKKLREFKTYANNGHAMEGSGSAGRDSIDLSET